MKTRILRAIVCLSTVIVLALCLTSCDAFDKLFAGGGVINSGTNNDDNGGTGNDHTHSFRVSVVKPTCTEGGYTTHTCACGEFRTDSYTDPTGHKYGAWEKTKSASCEEAGSEKRECSNCDAFEINEIAPLTHDYEEEIKDPTCTAEGSHLYKCKNCGKSWVFKTTKDHEFTTEIKIITDSTCTEKGHGKVYCAGCEENIEVDIEPKGHEYSLKIVDEKIYKNSLTVVVTCKNCNDYNKKNEETIITSYEKRIVVATCKSEGSVIYSFELDGETRDFECEKTPKSSYHTLNGIKIDPNENYTYKTNANGILEFDGPEHKINCSEYVQACYFCDDCDEAQLINVKWNHTYDETSKKVSPTCIDSGSEIGYCVVCKDSNAYTEISALGHSYKINSVTEGRSKITVDFSCDDCNFTSEEEINDFGLSETCNTREYVFKICDAEFKYANAQEIHVFKNEKYNLAIDSEGNLINAYYFVDGMVPLLNKIATCQIEGMSYFTCEDCDKFVCIKIKKDHTYDEKSIVNNEDLNCEDPLKYTVYCDECHKDIPLEVGHKYEVKNLSAENNSIVVDIACSECDFTKKDLFVDDYEYEYVKASCIVNGSLTYTFEFNEKELTYIKDLGASSHKLGGKEIDLNESYFVVDGIIEFTNEIATCSKTGKGYYKCEVCKEMQFIITKLPHDFGNNPVIDSQKATCDTDGWEKRYCNVCNTDVTYDIPALGHNWKVLVDEAQRPTEEKDGTVKIYCTGCTDEPYIVSLPALNKSDYEVKEKVSVTCEDPGYIEYTYIIENYDNAKAIIVVETEKIPHTEGNLITWTAESGGVLYEYKGYVCTVCGKVVVNSKTEVNTENS